MYLCARTFDFASFSVLIFDFGIVPTMWYILCLHLLHNHDVFVTQNATNMCVHTAWIETKLYTTIHRGRIVMVAGFTITSANCAYHWDKDCQWLAAGRWFSLCTPISSTNEKKPYNWNIVESGVEHHNPNPMGLLFSFITSSLEKQLPLIRQKEIPGQFPLVRITYEL
jgi:hypothetical protein